MESMKRDYKIDERKQKIQIMKSPQKYDNYTHKEKYRNSTW